MVKKSEHLGHSAEAVALAFYYQTLYALLTLLRTEEDDAAVSVEQLDDVTLNTSGGQLLVQLKHSIRENPPPITLKTPSLWRTLKVWIDALPTLTLSQTTFHLVTVASVPTDSPLSALISSSADRNDLLNAMEHEAQRVIEERTAASRNEKSLPHSERVDACESFLALSPTDRLNLLRRIELRQASPTVDRIEDLVAGQLRLLPGEHRLYVARRLVEWWDREVMYSLCGKRRRLLSMIEVQQQIAAIISEMEQEKLSADFETVSNPADYQPDGMLSRQINLVNGTRSDLAKAIREEWRARSQRAKWLNERPGMASVIEQYDEILKEHWSDRHSQMVDECGDLSAEERCARGLALLRWTHSDAPTMVRPVVEGWSSAYYVRGTYQVLAVTKHVGWHPEYLTLLEDE